MIDRTQIAIEARSIIVRQLRSEAEDYADNAEQWKHTGTGYTARLCAAKAAIYTEAADALERAARDNP